MRFSPAFNSCWVFYAMSQLLPAAQRCSTFLRINDVPNKAIIWALPVISGVPTIVGNAATKSFETVPRALYSMAPLQLLPGVSVLLQKLTPSIAQSSKPQSSQYSSHRNIPVIRHSNINQ